MNRALLKIEYNLFDLIGDHETGWDTIKIEYLDILIISRIIDFQNDNKKCYITDDKLSEIFHASRNKIQRSIKRLKDLNILESQIFFDSNSGMSVKHRYLSINIDTIKRIIDK